MPVDPAVVDAFDRLAGVAGVSRKSNPKLPCPECDGLRSADAPRCRSCYLRKSAERRLCPQCKARYRKHSTTALCKTCCFANRGAHLICSGCGGRKSLSRVKRCSDCRTAAGRNSDDRDASRLVHFDRHAFRALLEREEWSVRDLGHAARLSSTTIWQWLSGVRKPRLTEWRMAAEALALDPCIHCGGSGTVNATEGRIEAITAAVQHPRKSVLLLSPSTEEQNWQLDPNQLVLTVNGVGIHITPQESRLVTALASAQGHYVPTTFISEAMRRAGRGPTPHAIHTYLARLRDKCDTAGLDLAVVIQNGRGAGYRAVMATQSDVAS